LWLGPVELLSFALSFALLNVSNGATLARPGLQALFAVPARDAVLGIFAGSAWLVRRVLLGRTAAAAHNKE
jgi:hypothetical protein